VKFTGNFVNDFIEVIERGGHSTYMVLIQPAETRIASYWSILKKLGCSYESAHIELSIGRRLLYSVDIPPTADIHEVYETLERGEDQGVWIFQEGYAHFPGSPRPACRPSDNGRWNQMAREMEINELLIEAFERLEENYTARENCSWPSSPTANWRKPNWRSWRKPRSTGGGLGLSDRRFVSPKNVSTFDSLSKIDTSGKSPAYVHHRKNWARAGKLVAGFLNRATSELIEPVAWRHGNYPATSQTTRCRVRWLKRPQQNRIGW
jgi:hypothetical protein